MDLESIWTCMLAALRAVGSFVDHWQTLLAGALAFLGAFWAVVAANRQTLQAKDEADTHRMRLQNIARTGLMPCLAEMSGWVEQCSEALRDCLPEIYSRPKMAGFSGSIDIEEFREEIFRFDIFREFTLPKFQASTTSALISAQADSPDEIAPIVAILIHKAYLAESRLRRLKSDALAENPLAITNEFIGSLFLDLAVVLWIVNRIFPFARFVQEAVDLSKPESGITEALIQLRLTDGFIEYLVQSELVSKWAARCSPPTNP